MKAAVQRLFSPNGSREPSVVGTQSRTGSVQGGDNHHRQPLDRQSNWSGSGPRSEIDDRDKRWAQQGATSAGPQPVRLPRPPDPPAPENAQKPPPVPKGDVRRLLALPENERKVLASRRHVFFKTADRGDCILRKGDPVKCVYVILSGLVMVFRSGNNYADYSVGPGDLFGDEVFSNTKSMKTFRAANEITYVEVDSHFFMKSELMSSFRVQMARGGDGELSPGGVAGGKKAGTRTEEEEREATTTTNSSRAATERGFRCVRPLSIHTSVINAFQEFTRRCCHLPS